MVKNSKLKKFNKSKRYFLEGKYFIDIKKQNQEDFKCFSSSFKTSST